MPRRPPAEKPKPELWQAAADWSSNGPHGAAPALQRPAPCKICGKPSYLLSPEKKVPMHKGCAEEWTLVHYLGPILASLLVN